MKQEFSVKDGLEKEIHLPMTIYINVSEVCTAHLINNAGAKLMDVCILYALKCALKSSFIAKLIKVLTINYFAVFYAGR